MRALRHVLALPGEGRLKPAGSPSSRQAGTSRKMFLLTTMYMSQAIPMGFIMGSLPVIMRASGMSLKAIGFLFMLHLPWAFKFIYASYIDSFHIKKIGRRRTWILPMQWLTVLLFAALSQAPPERSFGIMFGLFLLAAFAMATNDIAVDGYATDMLTSRERPWGNTIQSGARSMGMVIGGGIPLVFYDLFGWQSICFLLAAALLLLSLPVLFHREIPSQHQLKLDLMGNRTKVPGMISIIKKPDTRWLIVFLILPTVFFFLGFQMRLPLLSDLGLDPQTMGLALIWCGSPAGLLGSFLGGYLFQRLGPLAFLRWFVLSALGLTALTVFLVNQEGITIWSGLLVLGLDNFLLGAIHVWAFTLMMKASVGPHSGTSFALFSSVFLLPPLLFAPIFGAVGDNHGFVTLYLLLAGLLVVGFFMAKAIAGYRLQALFKPENS